MPIVISTRRPRDLFRKRYWVICLSLSCDLREGPWAKLWVAQERCREVDEQSRYAADID
jgi:hypothetical protein